VDRMAVDVVDGAAPIDFSRELRDSTGGGLLLGQADGGRRQARPVRLADRPVPSVLADRTDSRLETARGQDREKANRALSAMLQMTRLDIGRLKQAFDG
jgi:hypothetical protein